MKTPKEIVYLNDAQIIPPEWDNKKRDWKPEEIKIKIHPTKCIVTIENNIVIGDVYVDESEEPYYRLYKDYKIEKYSHGTSETRHGWYAFKGLRLVMEFKSDNFRIEAM